MANRERGRDMLKGLTVGLGVLAFVAIGAATASAQSKCSASKLKATGKKASCRLGVYAKAVGKAVPVDTLKLQGCTDKFGPAFDKAETKPPCLTTGDKSAIESKTDAATNNMNSSIGVSPPSKCQSSLLKAAGKKAKCKLGVYAKGVAKNVPADTVKLQGCTDKFTAAAAKAAAGSDCGSAPSGATIENDVDAYVNDARGELAPAGPPSCAPVVIGQPIAPTTYRLNGTTDPQKRCTTASTMNRFGTCSSDTDCGGIAGTCLQLPWVTADGQTLSFPTGVQTTFTVETAAAAPACEHIACVPCGN